MGRGKRLSDRQEIGAFRLRGANPCTHISRYDFGQRVASPKGKFATIGNSQTCLELTPHKAGYSPMI